jgi:hypothetical protein
LRGDRKNGRARQLVDHAARALHHLGAARDSGHEPARGSGRDNAAAAGAVPSSPAALCLELPRIFRRQRAWRADALASPLDRVVSTRPRRAGSATAEE